MENLIKKIAWSFHTTTGIDMDDLIQEASLAYLKALRTHNPDKGKITTHVWNCVSSHLKNYIKDEMKFKAEDIDEINPVILPYETPAPFWEGLNSEAQEIAKTILELPNNFATYSREDAQVEITKTLLDKGWDWIKIRTGMKDLRAKYSVI